MTMSFVLTYQFAVLFFSICYMLLFVFILLKPRGSQATTASQRSEWPYIVALLTLLILPWVIYAVLNPDVFRSIDIYVYMPDSQEILRQGIIPSSGIMLENQYYASFPVFTLLISALTSMSGLTVLQGVVIINVAIQILFWLSIWVLLKRNADGNFAFKYVFFGLLVAGYANPYLYGYFNTPLPQTAGLCFLLLLFFLSMQSTKSTSLIYIIFLAVSLVHVTVLPVFLLALIMILALNLVTKKTPASTSKINNSLSHLSLPVIIFSAYLLYTIAIYSVSGYLTKIVAFMSDLTKDALSGQLAVSEGLPRGMLYPINALGPALIIGAVLSFLVMYYISLRRHEKVNNLLAAIAITALLLIFLGTLRGQFTVWGTAFFSISRYFNLPGFALATVVTGYVVTKAFSNQQQKWCFGLLCTAITLSAIGGFLDPLVF